jgi:hypothetical protein
MLDMDGDGLRDLFLCTRFTSGWYRAHSDGTFESEPVGVTTGCETYTTVVSGDIDGDGVDDILKFEPELEPAWSRYRFRPGMWHGVWEYVTGLPGGIEGQRIIDAWEQGRTRWLDVNGDGLRDLYALTRSRAAPLTTR